MERSWEGNQGFQSLFDAPQPDKTSRVEQEAGRTCQRATTGCVILYSHICHYLMISIGLSASNKHIVSETVNVVSTESGCNDLDEWFDDTDSLMDCTVELLRFH